MQLSQMLQDLIDGGMSQDEIAAKVGTNQSTISRMLRNGQNSKLWDIAKNIEQLHKTNKPTQSNKRSEPC